MPFLRNPGTLPFDRVLGNSDQSLVVYADVTSPLFGEFHKELSKRALEGEFTYRVRYRPSTSGYTDKLFVGGYGVELALKRTDYIVIDDRDAEQSSSSLKDAQDGAKSPPPAANDLKEESPADLKPLSASEVSTLAVNAASFVMSSEDPFATLLKLSQDFPRHSSVIASVNATADFLDELTQNQENMLPPGYDIVWINGVQVNSRNVNAFSLLNHLRHERKLINSFRELGFSAAEAVKLLSDPIIANSQAPEDAPRYDYRDETEGGGVIIWLNDLEKDKRYEEWPRELGAVCITFAQHLLKSTNDSQLLQRMYPGQFPQVRRDIHNVVIPLNFANPSDVELLVSQLQMFIARKIPVRFGLVPLLKDDSSTAQARIASYLRETYGLEALLGYFEMVRAQTLQVMRNHY